jgi:hypothetical protein
MKVVHIGHVVLPPTHPDYAQLRMHPGRWVLNLAMAQKAHADITAEIVVPVPAAEHDFFTVLDGVPVHFVAMPARYRATTLFRIDRHRLIAKIRQINPDIVHGMLLRHNKADGPMS